MEQNKDLNKRFDRSLLLVRSVNYFTRLAVYETPRKEYQLKCYEVERHGDNFVSSYSANDRTVMDRFV